MSDDVEAGARTIQETDDAVPAQRRSRLLLFGSIGVLGLALIVFLSVFFSRRKSIDVVTVDEANQESIASLIKVAPISGLESNNNGTTNNIGEPVVTIEYTTAISDPSKKFYYLNVQDLNYTQISKSPENLNLILTEPSMPTLSNVGDNPILIMNLAATEFPYRLQDDFLPGDYKGLLILEGTGVEGDAIILTGSFAIVVDRSEDIGSSTNSAGSSPPPIGEVVPTGMPSEGPSSLPSFEPSNLPSVAPSIVPTSTRGPSSSPTRTAQPSGTSEPTETPSKSPTPSPTQTFEPSQAPTISPTAMPTKAPSPAPTNSPTTKAPTGIPTAPPTAQQQEDPLPILISSLESSDYNIDGTITITTVTSFVSGQVVSLPVLQFDIPEAARAPGPYLYLSKRPYSETFETGRLDSTLDIYIPLDDGEDGSFTLQGKFEQPLDELASAAEIEEYRNGSWIVWCRPFGVWLGGGSIAPQE